jgi:hypothetical protein
MGGILPPTPGCVQPEHSDGLGRLDVAPVRQDTGVLGCVHTTLAALAADAVLTRPPRARSAGHYRSDLYCESQDSQLLDSADDVPSPAMYFLK